MPLISQRDRLHRMDLLCAQAIIHVLKNSAGVTRQHSVFDREYDYHGDAIFTHDSLVGP